MSEVVQEMRKNLSHTALLEGNEIMNFFFFGRKTLLHSGLWIQSDATLNQIVQTLQCFLVAAEVQFYQTVILKAQIHKTLT